MLGWDRQYSHSILSEADAESDLIDHTKDPASEETQRLAWDGRKGQWIPLAYSYTFPGSCFDQLECGPSGLQTRRVASYSFPPSKRHAVMLDQGSPKLRIVPRTTLQGRNPRIQPMVSKSPLVRVPWDETEDEETSWEPFDPFNLDSRPVQTMPWLDDINIEEFLSSAIDYQTDCRLNIPMSEPVYTSRGAKPNTPCTPSSPPPPIFTE
jgi:hypothetical protein